MEDNTSIQITITNKISRGAYGTVYSGIKDPDNVDVAIKRNTIEARIDFLGSVRELDFLSRLKHHPFIIKIQTISLGVPKSVCPLSPIMSGFKADPLYMVFEKAAYDGFTLFHGDVTTINALMLAMVQILLSMEYMHAKGIVHLDMKPPNLLWVRKDAERFMKISDFGMAKNLILQEENSTNVVTSWYRAPEIAGKNPNYTEKADIWSVGCIFYEALSRDPICNGIPDNNTLILNRICAIQPKIPTADVMKKINVRGYALNDREIYSKKRITFIKRASQSLNSRYKMFSEIENGNEQLTYFEDLLEGLLQLDPDRRLSATQALNHPFFSAFREYIEMTRYHYPPIADPSPIINIHECIERSWASDACFCIYNTRSSKDSHTKESLFPWYSHRILFQALDLFDRYLHYRYLNSDFKNDIIENEERGRLHSKVDSDIYFMGCIYLAIKCLSNSNHACSFIDIIAPNYHTAEYYYQAEQFELFMLTTVLEFHIYRPTIYDIFPFKLTPIDVRNLLLFYGRSSNINSVPLNDLLDSYVSNILSQRPEYHAASPSPSSPMAFGGISPPPSSFISSLTYPNSNKSTFNERTEGPSSVFYNNPPIGPTIKPAVMPHISTPFPPLNNSISKASLAPPPPSSFITPSLVPSFVPPSLVPSLAPFVPPSLVPSFAPPSFAPLAPPSLAPPFLAPLAPFSLASLVPPLPHVTIDNKNEISQLRIQDTTSQVSNNGEKLKLKIKSNAIDNQTTSKLILKINKQPIN